MTETTASETPETETQKAEYSFSHDPGHNRYVANYDGDIVGFAAYRPAADGVHFNHTVVDQAHQGEGVASRLIRYALDDFERTSNQAVIPDCSYVRAWLQNHPDYQHLTEERA
ncbi:GNAT family N-acetyltransferase [Gulosibacter molinativorax]|uniref:N-acetyltransferase n=1 Tax=Gulosibacter molinativorax TaxID=256821 RepID=A0ABT7C6A1_9MICO|nr:GNAT family N-acetyltransferase [Gulosibacter molinativorax]MDJ1370706.1 N-acetyltransferase [Gulosibacter molinativorax]QUY63268.1 Hypotetical protein [Gulosibacter molinativorax]